MSEVLGQAKTELVEATRLLAEGDDHRARDALLRAEEVASAISSELLRAKLLSQIGLLWGALEDWNRAEAVLRRISTLEPFESGWAYTRLAEQLLRVRANSEAKRLLQAADGAAHLVERPLHDRAYLLSQMARVWLLASDVEKANRLWQDAIDAANLGQVSEDRQYAMDSGSVLWEIAEEIALAGQPQWALEIADSIRMTGTRANALEALDRIAAGGHRSVFWSS